jgi:hypothetical protein
MYLNILSSELVDVFELQYILTFALYSADSVASQGKKKYIFEGHQPQFFQRTAKTIS